MKAQVDVKVDVENGTDNAILGSTVQGATETEKEALAEAKELFWSLSVGDQLRVSGHPGSSPKAGKIDGRVASKQVNVDLAAHTFHYTIHVK